MAGRGVPSSALPPVRASASLGLSPQGWRAEGTGSAWRWGKREGGGGSPWFPLRNGGEWREREGVPWAFCPRMAGSGGSGARWGAPLGFLNEDNRLGER